MSRPPINPDKTLAGIAVDPRTLERVIPESRRPDGTVRKQIKIRPGFTPQEDVRRFRGTRQAQMDAVALPKGHIVGWVPPSNGATSKAMTSSGNAFPALGTAASNASSGERSLSKAAKKNAKRKEKREEKKAATDSSPIKDNWDDDEEDGGDTKDGEPESKKTETTTTTTEAVSDTVTLESKLSNLQLN